jgi:hypothetical protein
MHMHNDRLKLDGASEDELLACFRQMGIKTDSSRLANILCIVKIVGTSDETIESWFEYPRLPEGVIGFIIPTTYYNVNVKRTSLIVAAAIMDALATFGLASAGLAVSGLAKQGIAKLDTRSGEYCCAVQSAKLHEGGAHVTPQAVHRMIYGKPCPFLGLGCRLLRENTCNSAETDIKVLFESLEEKGAMVKKGDEWQVPI